MTYQHLPKQVSNVLTYTSSLISIEYPDMKVEKVAKVNVTIILQQDEGHCRTLLSKKGGQELSFRPASQQWLGPLQQKHRLGGLNEGCSGVARSFTWTSSGKKLEGKTNSQCEL